MTSHAIPLRLDSASKVLIFDADVAFLGFLGLFTGIVLLDNMPLGMLLGFGFGWVWSRLKSGRHPAYHLHLLYWFLPRLLRCTPPSFLRELVG